jgi:hypothetical protein
VMVAGSGSCVTPVILPGEHLLSPPWPSFPVRNSLAALILLHFWQCILTVANRVSLMLQRHVPRIYIVDGYNKKTASARPT